MIVEQTPAQGPVELQLAELQLAAGGRRATVVEAPVTDGFILNESVVPVITPTGFILNE